MRDSIRKNTPVIGAAVRSIILFTTVMAIPLSAAETLGLTEAQTSAWILALYGVGASLNLALSLIYRQPILLTGNIFIIIFIVRLGTRLSYPELIGAAMLAGALVLLVGLLGLTYRLAKWVPVPIVYALLGGVVLTFVADIFNQMSDEPFLVGGTFLVYLLSQKVLGGRVPAIFPALVAGLTIAAFSGQFDQLATPLSLEMPRITRPDFSVSAVLTATPVMVVLITLQSNLPSVRYLESQGYRPPDKVINAISGVGTVLASFLGPIGISLSLPATSLVAGPDAGDVELRYRASFLSSTVALLVGLLAGIATALAAVIPPALLLALAGLALFNVLLDSIARIVQGPLKLGPVFTLAIVFSDISLLGFGSFFWALVIGTAVSLLLERDGFTELRKKGEQDQQAVR